MTLDDESPDPHPTRTAAIIAPTTSRLDCRVPRRRDRCRDMSTRRPERCDDATPTATLMTPESHRQGTSARARGPQQAENAGFLTPAGPLGVVGVVWRVRGRPAVRLPRAAQVSKTSSKSASTMSDHQGRASRQKAPCFQRRCVTASVTTTRRWAVTSRCPRTPGQWRSGASPGFVPLRIVYCDIRPAGPPASNATTGVRLRTGY